MTQHTLERRPMPTQSQALRLVNIMEELIALMERENTAVSNRDQDALPDMVARKQRLLIDYQAEFNSVTHNPAWLNNLPEKEKSLLRRLGEALREAAERNARVLKAAATATQRLLHGIMASVRDEKCAPLGYQHLAQSNTSVNAPSVIINTSA